MALPSTSTSAICMEKASRPQKPLVLPQAFSTFSGPILVAIIAKMYTMTDRMTANRKGSGSHLLTTRTQPLVNFLNTDFTLLINTCCMAGVSFRLLRKERPAVKCTLPRVSY